MQELIEERRTALSKGFTDTSEGDDVENSDEGDEDNLVIQGRQGLQLFAESYTPCNL